MYSGENKTARSSQKAFCEALLRLMRQKEYARITVSELCQESGISRQTFYALFGTKDNVLRYQILHNYIYPGDAFDDSCTAARRFAHSYTHYLILRQDFLRMLVENKLIHIFYECCLHWITQNQAELLHSAAPDQENYLCTYIASTLTGFLNACFTAPQMAPEDQLEETLYHLLSGSYLNKP